MTTIGGYTVMEEKKSKYGKVKEHEEEILTMFAVGKTHKEIAEYFGFKDRLVIKDYLKRRRRRERKIAQGVLIPRKGRTSINTESYENVDNKIKRLTMENELLRDFLLATGRK
jgi:hypothetical protein